MVPKKKQYYGFNGFHVPFVPRAPRSARRRGKKVDDSQICAFELLASLAGKLLQESESSSASSNASDSYQLAVGKDVIKHEQYEGKLLKTECVNKGCYEGSVFVPDFPSPNKDPKLLLKDSVHGESDSILDRSSVITDSVAPAKVNIDAKSVFSKIKTCGNFPCKVEEGSFDFGGSIADYLENSFCTQNGVDGLASGGSIINNTCSSKDPVKLSTKMNPASVDLNNNKLPSCRDKISNASILGHRNGVKLGITDDDEKFSRFNKLMTKPKTFKPPSRIGDRRIRKLLTSKYWRVAPKLKDCERSKFSVLDGGMKSLYRKRKLCCNRDRYQCDTLYKRRKFSDHGLVVTSDGGFSSRSVCNSPKKGKNDKNGSDALFNRASGISSSVTGRQASFQAKDSYVKFSIKSFKIPELFIEVPETATVGSLKRTVLEAVTAILGDGLHVGVLLHGKKVRDDNRTLLQSGIASEELGFMLEPNLVQAPPSLCNEDLPALLPCDTSQPISKVPASPALASGISVALPDLPPLTSPGNNVNSNHEPVSSNIDILADKTLSNSKALVPIPPVVSVKPLAMVPVNQKSRRSEVVQRRTRRPFSVSEVEALVQSVEELGTGRWRDVKLRSFENADYRTYVDLKDKWKTLVHTAKIAPQQRRGEPVPQELLDRVLATHTYWSQHHQVKQHGKTQASILQISDAPANDLER